MAVNKNAVQLFHEFDGNSQADIAISILRSREAAMWLALMAAHLGDGQRLDGQSLAAAMNLDLQILLRDYTPSTDAVDEEAPELVSHPDADALLRGWTAKGWLHRNVDPNTGREFYQLTSGAIQAVRQMLSLNRRSSVATESALTMVMDEMRQIATEADPDPSARRDAINEQIATLVAQRDELDQGREPIVDHAALIDKIVAIAQLIERIPSDIAHYGEQVQANTASLLRHGLSDDPQEFAESLQQMFDGHDVIAESAEGQAFRAFATLISQPDMTTRLVADIDEVLTRVEGIPEYLGEALTNFLDAMWQRVQDVEHKRKTAFRRIGNFVRGGDAIYYQSMRSRINAAQTAAMEAFQNTHGGRDTGFTIPVAGVKTSSIGRLRLSDGVMTSPEAITDSTQEYGIDSSDMVALESIDPDALRSAVNVALREHGEFVTLPDVLERLHEPRTGDIFYLWRLASAHGDVKEVTRSPVFVHTDRGMRHIDMPLIVFHQQVPELATPRTKQTSIDMQPTLMEGLSNAQ